MAIYTKASFIKGDAMGLECTITLGMGGMKGIGSMGDMTVMELRVGREGADTEGSTGRV